jgi:hypothetical protein
MKMLFIALRMTYFLIYCLNLSSSLDKSKKNNKTHIQMR